MIVEQHDEGEIVVEGREARGDAVGVKEKEVSSGDGEALEEEGRS